MEKHISPILLFFVLFFNACSPASPENYFDVAVLNSNFLMGFANDGQLRELESPSMKMAEKTSEPVQMKRIDVINTKVQFVETNLAKLKNLKITEDTKEIVLASLALHEHVLTAYRNEYTGLARSYDDGVSREQLVNQAQLIHEKYYSRYDELYNKLINLGKSYAAKHDIKVNWGM